MKAGKCNVFKNTVVLISPLLLFAILFVPYHWFNHRFLIDWLGCGCPHMDELGNLLNPAFSANDFTQLFWFFVTVCATVISFFLSKRIIKDKKALRIIYVIAIAAASLVISYYCCALNMWD